MGGEIEIEVNRLLFGDGEWTWGDWGKLDMGKWTFVRRKWTKGIHFWGDERIDAILVSYRNANFGVNNFPSLMDL